MIKFRFSRKCFLKMKCCVFVVFSIFLNVHVSYAKSYDYKLEPLEDGILLTVKSDYCRPKLTSRIGFGWDVRNQKCVGTGKCVFHNNVTLNVVPYNSSIEIKWETDNLKTTFKDCHDLGVGDVHWFGGPEKYEQEWPIEKLILNGSEPYVLKKTRNQAVMERYWLNSQGAYLFVEDNVPLFVDQNQEQSGQLCFIAKTDGPYVNRTRNILHYHIGLQEHAKTAHLDAVNKHLGKPTGHPNPKMIEEPIWTTWAKYKKNISDETVLSFAEDIRNHGFQKGQLEIDDNWEVCYGAQVFNKEQFANITSTVKSLKENDFRVTLWVHPFVDAQCHESADEGLEKGYFVKNISGSVHGSWWDGNDAYQIDFTKSEAQEWYLDRLKTLQKLHGIDSFKFDAGETDYSAQPAAYPHLEDQELIPNILSQSYVTTCSRMGNLIEFRSVWRTQHLPHFVRMIDKDSNWGDTTNGLHSLITTLLQMNLNGYTLVLPDMIGGNAYNGEYPTPELLARWTEANVFMPSMQFSFLPWEVVSDKFDGVAIAHKFVHLHAQYTDEILKAMNNSIQYGTPVNPPIWWVDPTDPVALANDDEYLLGEDILVAPVIVEGARSRDVYLPKGTWKDGNNGSFYEGPRWLRSYPAPIDVLPYFLRQ